MRPNTSISVGDFSLHRSLPEKERNPNVLRRVTASVLLGFILIFSVFAVNQTNAHSRATADQQEVLQGIPTMSASDALISGGLSSLPFAVYFFIYSHDELVTQLTSLTYALKESLFITTFLRNPFYVFTSIHAP